MEVTLRQDSVRTGYKQTEVGVIPEDWGIRILGDEIEQLEAGISVNSVDEATLSFAHDESVLKTSAVSNGKFIPEECKKIAPRDLYRAKLNPRKNTIIFSRMNTPELVGECGYVNDNFTALFLPDRLWMTRFKRQSQISVQWLCYLLNIKEYKTKIKSAATGTSGSMKNISKGMLLSIKFPCPNPIEQTAIATALSDTDALIQSLEKLIAKKRAIKQGAMQELLTGKRRLPGFVGEWVEKRLGEIAEVVGGGTPSTFISSYWNGDINWFTPTEIGFSKYVYHSMRKITVEGHKNSSARILPIGTVLLTSRAGIGDVSILKCEACTNQGFQSLIAKSEFNFEFLYYLVSTLKNVFLQNASGSTFLEISPSKVKQTPIMVASFTEQTAIATILSDMDTELTALEQRLAKTRIIKQGMMQELLTGKTRLNHGGR